MHINYSLSYDTMKYYISMSVLSTYITTNATLRRFNYLSNATNATTAFSFLFCMQTKRFRKTNGIVNSTFKEKLLPNINASLMKAICNLSRGVSFTAIALQIIFLAIENPLNCKLSMQKVHCFFTGSSLGKNKSKNQFY